MPHGPSPGSRTTRGSTGRSSGRIGPSSSAKTRSTPGTSRGCSASTGAPRTSRPRPWPWPGCRGTPI
jgi:hypothetical protein